MSNALAFASQRHVLSGGFAWKEEVTILLSERDLSLAKACRPKLTLSLAYKAELLKRGLLACKRVP